MSSILPKNKLENVNFCPSLLGQKFFVHFLGELKKPKSPFEINWPLGIEWDSMNTSKLDYHPKLYSESLSAWCGWFVFIKFNRIWGLDRKFSSESDLEKEIGRNFLVGKKT